MDVAENFKVGFFLLFPFLFIFLFIRIAAAAAVSALDGHLCSLKVSRQGVQVIARLRPVSTFNFFFFFFIPAIVPLVKGVRALLIINSDALLTVMAPAVVGVCRSRVGEDPGVNPEVSWPIPSPLPGGR